VKSPATGGGNPAAGIDCKNSIKDLLGDDTFDFMKSINLAIVGLRLLAVYCFIQAIPLFSTFAIMFAPKSPSYMQSIAIFTGLLPGGLLLILSILLFVFSESLARRIISTTSTEPSGSVCTFEQVQSIAFAVVGVLIVAMALPNVGHALQGLVDMYDIHKQGADIPPHQVFKSGVYCTGVVAQLIVGALLLLNPKGFRNIWRYLRTAGT